MELEEGLKIDGFCCAGFDWHVFSIGKDGTVYTKCANPDCRNSGVFLPEFGEIEQLKARLAAL